MAARDMAAKVPPKIDRRDYPVEDEPSEVEVVTSSGCK